MKSTTATIAIAMIAVLSMSLRLIADDGIDLVYAFDSDKSLVYDLQLSTADKTPDRPRSESRRSWTVSIDLTKTDLKDIGRFALTATEVAKTGVFSVAGFINRKGQVILSDASSTDGFFYFFPLIQFPADRVQVGDVWVVYTDQYRLHSKHESTRHFGKLYYRCDSIKDANTRLTFWSRSDHSVGASSLGSFGGSMRTPYDFVFKGSCAFDHAAGVIRQLSIETSETRVDDSGIVHYVVQRLEFSLRN